MIREEKDMRQEHKATFLKGLFWTLILTLFLISFSVVFTLYMEPLYWADIRLMGLEKASGKSAEIIRKNYHAMVSYMYLWNRTPVLTLPDFAMSQGGKIHFADCKRIFDAVQAVCAMSGFLTILSAVVHRHSLRYRYLRAAGTLTILIPALLGGLAYMNWNKVFLTFHKILFRNNYWIFDPASDPVILILPDTFFLQCVIVIAVVLVTGAGILFGKAHRRSRRLRDRIARSRARGRRR